jgi:polyisoprenoid-binding protein YceI
MKNIITIVFCLAILNLNAQDKFFTKTGKIDFFSKAQLEDIEARNKTVGVLLDTKTGNLQFSVLMKGFEFEKALMQEHFNDNYVESDKFPKSEFTGSILNNTDINFLKDGSYNAKVKGELTLHGVTRTVETMGSIKVNNGRIDGSSEFNILLSDFKIKVPSVVKNKLSNNIKIKVEFRLEPLKG